MVELINNMMNLDCFQLAWMLKNITTIVKELKSKGEKITMEPTQITVGTLAFLEDPNGVRIALIQHH